MDKNLKGTLICMIALSVVLGITEIATKSKRVVKDNIVDVKCKELN